MKANYQVYKRFCDTAEIMGVKLTSDLSESEIVKWEAAINQLALQK